MKLTDEIVNKGIAEFMGHPSYMIKHHRHVKFTSSLDALVPVWEKYKIAFQVLPQGNGYTFLVMGTDIWIEEKTIQQAAAYATYKAAKELGLI